MLNQKTDSSGREELSLLELNNKVRQSVSSAFPDTCWIRAEMSDVRVNSASGHCYLEFVEKDLSGKQLVAKARGTIWGRTYQWIRAYFEEQTGQLFTSGLKVLVKVSVDFHAVYGFNLTVQDIDPSYTIGDMVRKRMEIIKLLQEEGVLHLNKELLFPQLPQRIAIITSPTAAGYEDFMNQLTNNTSGYIFYPKLFPAIMQGEKTEESVIAALDKIYTCQDCFDVVVIIRGGGATSELNSFDSYLLAANVAQFPLPVITGIGHERDDTVLDMVAHTRMKTPTAVAEFLIKQVDSEVQRLTLLQQGIIDWATGIIQEQKNYLQLLATRLPHLSASRIEQNRILLHTLVTKLPAVAKELLLRQQTFLDLLQSKMKNDVATFVQNKRQQLELDEQFVKMVSPEYVLKRGFSLTLKDGKIVKAISGLQPGDKLITRLADGEISSEIETIEKLDIYGSKEGIL
ncbi:exodeoxyribonuclease VII large subunit [Parabacteroides sp. OttesenSCG-928-G07]|nr:exodeoxyribonuclease VII large subunit [Parabacteroides sp. OttesenSCG-928-G21]MDL2278497.1 exodeoxyribonuclease VII large subunit [Parabacteroides sp. OttesenSCG-928-G07]